MRTTITAAAIGTALLLASCGGDKPQAAAGADPQRAAQKLCEQGRSAQAGVLRAFSTYDLEQQSELDAAITTEARSLHAAADRARATALSIDGRRGASIERMAAAADAAADEMANGMAGKAYAAGEVFVATGAVAFGLDCKNPGLNEPDVEQASLLPVDVAPCTGETCVLSLRAGNVTDPVLSEIVEDTAIYVREAIDAGATPAELRVDVDLGDVVDGEQSVEYVCEGDAPRDIDWREPRAETIQELCDLTW